MKKTLSVLVLLVVLCASISALAADTNTVFSYQRPNQSGMLTISNVWLKGVVGVDAANIAMSTAAITATGTVTVTKQGCLATNSAGAEVTMLTNVTAVTAITVLNGGVVVTNISIQASP